MSDKNTKNKRAGAITWTPTADVSKKVETLAERLRLPKNGLVELATETLLTEIESGRARVVNGQVEFVPAA